jgi:o-succinylbenzoate---CoA ligase
VEPDLDRLFDFESGGSLYPQFVDTWKSRISAARALAKSIESDGNSERVRIALSVLDPESFCALFLALGRGDFDLFCFNPNWGERERSEAMAIAKPHWILGDFSGEDFSKSIGSELAQRSIEITDGLRIMIPTGGTSGAVRFTMHRWSSLASAAYGFQSFFEADRISSFCVLPLYHVSGFMQLIRSLLTMGKLVFGTVDAFENGHAALRKSETQGCFLSLVATQLERLLRDRSNWSLLKQYRAIFVGGGPVSEGLLKKAAVLELPLAPTYGMSETAAQVATLKPDDFLKGKAGQGKALPHARLSIVDEAGNPLSFGEVGRIQIWSNSLFRGYYGETERSVDSVVAPDFGSLDEFNNLTVLGRSDRVIISGGEKIDLREIERALEATDLLSDAVAFGVDDREWGTRLAVACVPARDSITEQQVKAALSENLANFKMPKVWLSLNSLPRNEAGKIMLESLLDRVSNPN